MQHSKGNLINSFFLTFLVLLINGILPSQTNGFSKGTNLSILRLYENENSKEVFTARYNDSEFRRRPLVLESQKWLFDNNILPYQASFNLINYIILFLLFLSIPYLSQSFGEKLDDGFYSQILFFFSMPILFAFLGSICTYDDILQYFILTLFIIFLNQKKYLKSFILFFVACICRETSIIFLLYVYYSFFITFRNNVSFYLYSFMWTILCIIGYFVFLQIYLPDNMIQASHNFLLNKRFSAWEGNFANFNNFRESSTIIFIMTCIYCTLMYGRKQYFNPYIKNILILLIGLNILIVAITGLIRESRLLLLPMILVIPFIQGEFKHQIFSFYSFWKNTNWVMLIKIIIISSIISFIWYSPKTYGTGFVFKIYVFLYTIFVATIFIKYYDKRYLNSIN